MSTDIFLVTSEDGTQYTQGHPGWLIGDELETARPLTADELMDHGYGILIQDVVPEHNSKTQRIERKPISEWLHTERLVTVVYVVIDKTIEEQRAEMPVLTPRQIRLGLNSIGVTSADVASQLPTEADRIEWNYATSFQRGHPLIVSMGPLFNLTPEQIDSLWEWSAGL